jgi:DNA-binding response OmpR family regulator
MSQGQKQKASTVLVLETDPSLRRLIALGLVHRGLLVIEADSLASVSTTDISAVDLLVLDIDAGVTRNWPAFEALPNHPSLASVATIVLAWDAPAIESNAVTKVTQAPTTFLPKPFDARALHATVENLLAARSAEKLAREAQAEAILLASYARHTAPSAWPVITAAGLLLLVFGLLLQFVLAIIGVLIAVVGLLLWTLGGSPRTTEITLGV